MTSGVGSSERPGRVWKLFMIHGEKGKTFPFTDNTSGTTWAGIILTPTHAPPPFPRLPLGVLQLNDVTNYPELAQAPKGRGSVP